MINKFIAILIILLFKGFLANAQPYVAGGKTRHRFAQLNLGVDQRLFYNKGSKSALINESGLIQEYKLNNQMESRLIIGGTHFWGHTDFYIAIPIVSIGKSGFSTGAETGAKYFPYKIEHQKIRPYIGIAWLPTKFQQGFGATMIRSKFPVTTGIVYNNKNHLLDFGLGYNHNNRYNYYINSNTNYQVKSQALFFSLGYKYMIETTLSAEQNWISGKTKKLTDTLAILNRLNGFTLAIGPSTAFLVKTSRHNNFVAPFTDDHKSFGVFPEFGIGYYLHKPDIQFNVAYRNMKSKIQAFEFSQTAQRKALTFEAFKFITDYHGFALFAGPAISYEHLKIIQNYFGNSTETFLGIKPGIVFGWDIRPNRLQAWYLRTNLRYFPNMNVKMPSNKNISLDQIEFNFIQLVVFPNRMFKF
jgi:hypothetical protein